jgi:beta-galactosidase beta subunit
MISEMSKTYQHLNPEINEALDKLYLNINTNSKDQKEKGILELHKTFLQRLSK